MIKLTMKNEEVVVVTENGELGLGEAGNKVALNVWNMLGKMLDENKVIELTSAQYQRVMK